MIEKMQMVHIVTTTSGKQEMLEGLRDIGILHLSEKKSADKAAADRVLAISKTMTSLKEYKTGKGGNPQILSDEAFEKLLGEVQGALERKAALIQEAGAAKAELERVQAWGEFSPAELNKLKAEGYDFHFYSIGKKELEAAVADESIRLIRLAPVDKMDTIAVLGTLPVTIPATEFALPEKSAGALQQTLSDCESSMEACNKILRDASAYEASFKAQLLKAQNQENFSAACATTESDNELVWLSGYVPAADIETFKTMAESKGCAWAVDEVADDDDQVPTKVRYNKISGLIQPVFGILGILPGYREQDVSLWFLLFFALFFAMIIGDGGYGLLILAGTLGFVAKTKKTNDTTFLLTVLSIATIIWGAITGTWFGMESAMKVPFLKAMVIPSFANYPEYFGLTASAQQNTIMKFSFTVGAIQMALGALLAVKKKMAEKNLSWIADLGWMVAVIAMYLLSLNLVIGEKINMVPVFILIATAFLLVVLFGGMSPDKSFSAGLKAGLADAFTVFLNTISCFGNVMSYIRLFAVGMAGLAIAQSFNAIGAGFSGPLVIFGIVIVLIGHALNLVMAFLSVVVHGVRLNVMEFSGQAGLEWTGIAYEPLKLKNK